jgi:hypothetical protein
MRGARYRNWCERRKHREHDSRRSFREALVSAFPMVKFEEATTRKESGKMIFTGFHINSAAHRGDE